MEETTESQYGEFRELLATMTDSVSAARASLQALQKQPKEDMTKGISLLSLKHQILISYLRSLVLVSSRRLLGDSLEERSPPTRPFSARDRECRGHQAGDLVDSMIEDRIVLEKIDALDSKMRYQIEKLVRLADEPANSSEAVDDPLAFKPNPLALVPTNSEPQEETLGYTKDMVDMADEDRIYRPPRLAPMPYVEKSKSKLRQVRPPVPSALANLAADPSRPYEETTTGLGGTPALASGRAKYLKRMQDFEEENFTRLIMKKSDAKRRARDEEDLALGGDLGGVGGRRSRAGGLSDEFNDVLRSVSRVSGGRSQGDGYEELRQKGKKVALLERTRSKRDFAHSEEGDEPSPRAKKRSRFELEANAAKKKLKLKRRVA